MTWHKPAEIALAALLLPLYVVVKVAGQISVKRAERRRRREQC